MNRVRVHDPRNCSLGEGPLWHPERKQLFWFDINNRRMLSRSGDEVLEWSFDAQVSAAGWVSRDELLIASETGLFLFNLATEERRHLCDLEADNPATRSNDGRADPQGGFWIGTMGKSAETGVGAIYRFHRGQLTRLYNGMTIPNSICFSPDGKAAFFTDTLTRQIMRQPLDAEGWPKGEPAVFIDLTEEGLNPDGSVVDAEGCLWNAQWGASRVARYSPDGSFLSAVAIPALQTSCSAFGGDGLRKLFVTSAAEGIESPSPAEGRTYSSILTVSGQPEHRVVL